MRTFLSRALGLLAALVLLAAAPYAIGVFGGGGLLLAATSLTTDAAMTNAMKVLFEDSIVNNVVTDTELLDIFTKSGGIKTDQTTGGRYIETAQLFALPAGVGARSENGYIPIPSGPNIQNSRVTLKKIMGSVEMSADTMKRVRTDEGAFIAWGEQAMPKLVERLKNELDRMLLGYGAGIKARVNAASPATNLLVDSAFGVTGYGGALYQFLEGETLRAGPNADGSSLHADVYTVEDVDHANGYVVVDGVTNLADDDYLFPGDSADDSAGIEPMGLLGIADDGGILATFQNIVRADYSAWRSLVVDAQASPFASGQQFTESLILYADDEAYTRGGAVVDMLLCSRLSARQYWNGLKGDRVINDPRSQMEGGKGRLKIHLGDRSVELQAVRKIPPSVAFGVTRKNLKKWMLQGFEWDDTTGSIWHQVVDSVGRKHAFYAYGAMWLECGSDDPRKSFRIEDIDGTVPTG